MIRWFDRDGEPLWDLMETERLLNDIEYKRVAWDPLPKGGHLSTVWLGLDHSHSSTGRPIIFETMALPRDAYGVSARYSTLREAQEGHALILAELTKRAAGTT